MKLEELIQKRFTEREGLTKFLVKFGDYPAIFSPEAPKDNQNWGTDVHYPRLVCAELAVFPGRDCGCDKGNRAIQLPRYSYKRNE